ncbi:DNA glycosylase [Conidiobolus coronatus NRRL 28638]|uniref:Endonuclease III homolog n=1 Tax=Conidiobolus coronatus (strain ATCC 28846 / CBS 209.66 / NRRL 28638) TaxID=796925 RepID=A0A137NUR2_CONC2|nr:DNA glycosylase [Conidiobolus coronatus NRRL 28638]|eukprot:KXN66344.1 DNA glycosylase [Conidiobolus coronatus NRRL 28638]
MSDSSSDEYEPTPVKRKAPVAKVKRVKTEPKSNVKEEFISNQIIEYKCKLLTFKLEIIPPSNWELVYNTLYHYRKRNSAPVDTMGCAQVDNSEIQGKDYRFHVLLSLMLSSRTKDETTFQAMKNIKQAINGPFNITNVSKLSSENLHACINKVGFHNQKLKFIEKSIKVCLEKFGGDVPDTLEGLTSLSGVGPKMAYLVLEHAWKQTIGIGVDIHVHRITNRLNWVRTNTPEQTRESLESWLPKKYWGNINEILVGFGQTICYGQRPKCGECPIQNYCPIGKKGFVKGEDLSEEDIGVKMEIDEEDNKFGVGSSNLNGNEFKNEGEPKVKLEYDYNGMDDNVKMES